MTNDLSKRLRALARCEHDDISIGDEAADALEEAETVIGRFAEVIDWFGRLQEMDRDVSLHVHARGPGVGGGYALDEPAFRAAAEWKRKHGTGR